MAEPQSGRGRGRAMGHARDEKFKDLSEAGEPVPGPSGITKKTTTEKLQSKVHGSKSARKNRHGHGDHSGKPKDKSKASQKGSRRDVDDDVPVGRGSGGESNDEPEDNPKDERKNESQAESQDESQDESEDGLQAQARAKGQDEKLKSPPKKSKKKSKKKQQKKQKELQKELQKESMKEPMQEPTKEPVKEPMKEPLKEPLKERLKEPMKEPTKEPMKDLQKEPHKKSHKKTQKESQKESRKEMQKEPHKEPHKKSHKKMEKEPQKETKAAEPKAIVPQPIVQRSVAPQAAVQRPVPLSAIVQRPAAPQAAVQRPVPLSAIVQRPAAPQAAVQRPVPLSAIVQRPAAPQSAVRRPVPLSAIVQRPVPLSAIVQRPAAPPAEPGPSGSSFRDPGPSSSSFIDPGPSCSSFIEPAPSCSFMEPGPSVPQEPETVDPQTVESGRPLSKKGTTGKPVNLLANYFELETLPDWTIYQYRVDFNVDEEREFQKKMWLKEHTNVLGHSYIFDGGLLFTARRLTVDNQPLTLTSIRDGDKFPVRIEVKFVQQLRRGNSVYLQVFNILVRRSLMNLQLQLVHRNYFDARAAIHLPEYNLEIWPGYVTSIRQNEGNILMCSEITHKIMRKDTARDLLLECIRTSPDYKTSFAQAIVGQVVLTDYNNRTYRIDDVDYSSTPTSTFKLKTNDEVSFMAYYEQRYKLKIRDTKQPLLVSRCTQQNNRDGVVRHCLLVPELCRMTGLDEKMAENTKLKKALSEHTRVSPGERMKRLLHFNTRLQQNPSVMQEFGQWEMKLSKKLVTVPARELPPEMIVGGRGQKYSAGSGTDWIREVRSRPMLKNGVINDWSVICPSFLAADTTSFLEALRKAAAGMDFRLPPPKMFQTPTDRPAHFMDAVENVLAVSKPDMIMFVCTNNRSDRYNAIKRKCCVDRGVQSQVILAKNLRTKGLSVATKVAIQLNCKLGGAPWSVDIPLQSVMVVGYDVCHDAQYKDRSYGAVVASLNSTLSSWFSVVSQHTNGDELTSALASDIGKALDKYREVNGSYPARIFVYRDGVGEGQINFVQEHEVNFLKKRLTQIYGGEHWKLGYIIVSKRINTRLFKENSNPRAGTVVDDVITLPERYDFFLVSQSVNVGTVTPTNYNVISDNLGLKPDQIQRWTYKMTHLYYNWSGTVRVPAPCQYAHKLAFLVGQSLHVPANSTLNSTLYFL